MDKRESLSWWQVLALCAGGAGMALLLVLVVLQLFPGLLPNPQTRETADLTLPVTFTYLDGDLWIHQRGRIRPPAENVALAQYTLQWDADGLRVPAVQADTYPIAAFGDSFTEGTTVALPWSDLLAAELDTPVRNYGYRGYGPKEIAQTAELFLPETAPEWILYAHFSGNDLGNANSSLQRDLMERNPFTKLDWLARQAGQNTDSMQPQINESGHYDYPMPVIIGSNYYELVFLEELLWWQTAPETGFLNSRTADVIREALTTIETHSADTTCHAFIFIPTKEQLYYRYIHTDVRQWLRNVHRKTERTPAGTIGFVDDPLTAADEADFIARLDEQRDAMRELAQAEGWLFIDLLAPFQEAVAGGALLYHRYDTHWNQDGHQLAADIIAGAMQAQGDTCAADS